MRYSFSLITILIIASTVFGQRGLPKERIPDPDPAKQKDMFQLPEGFEINLFASDPMIAKPIQMNFDSAGRLWVASSAIYPHIKPGQKANDKIIVLEDTNSDGKADKSRVFADGLLIPTGVEPDVTPKSDRAFVSNSTELLLLSDTDGDGKADQTRVVLSGFGTEDTHHILHTLRWGFDGNLYMNQSIYIHSHIETPYGVRRLNAGGIWQFRPDKMKLEVYAQGFVNTWGHHFNKWGASFATDGAYGEGINYVFPGAAFKTAGPRKHGGNRILRGLNPGQPKHCGIEMTSGRHLPEAWQNVLITNDFRGHRTNAFRPSEDGSGYASQQLEHLVTTKHIAYRPIDVKMGPDGAIYIADWYNPIIQHGEVDFRDERRDHVHGRIWRISYKGRPLVKPPKLVGASVEELLEALKAPEYWTRIHAKRQLYHLGADKVKPALDKLSTELTRQGPPVGEANEHLALEAFWTYQTLDVVNKDLVTMLCNSTNHNVRAAVMRVLGAWHAQIPHAMNLLHNGVYDGHPRVRLEAVRALALVGTPKAAEEAIAASLKPMDRFMDFALWTTMRELRDQWLPPLQRGEKIFRGNTAQLTYALSTIGSAEAVNPLVRMLREGKVAGESQQNVMQLIAQFGGPNELGMVARLVIDDAKLSGRAGVLNTLTDASRRRRIKPAGNLNNLVKLISSDADPTLQASACRAAGAWKVNAARQPLTAAAAGAKTAAPLRQAAIDGLAALGGKQSRDTFEQLCKAEQPLHVRMMASVAMTSIDQKTGVTRAVEALASAPAHVDTYGVFTPIIRQKGGPGALTAALKGKKLEPDVAKAGLRALRQSGRNAPPLANALMRAGGLTQQNRKLSPDQMKQMIIDVAKLGNPKRGEAIYRRKDMACMACHAIGGAGGRVGPDLSSIGSSAQIDYLVEAILEPNKAVKEGFHSVSVTSAFGEVTTGIVLRSSKNEIVLRNADDREIVIPRGDIEEEKPGLSLMPAGLSDPLTRQELVDLVAFLSQLGKEGPYAISRSHVARRWRTLHWNNEFARQMRATSIAIIGTNNPLVNWVPVYSEVSGTVPLNTLPQIKRFGNEVYSFARCDIEVTTPGKVRLLVNSPTGAVLFVDGKRVTVSKQIDLDLKAGTHALAFSLDLVKRKEGLRVELVAAPDSKAKAQFVIGK